MKLCISSSEPEKGKNQLSSPRFLLLRRDLINDGWGWLSAVPVEFKYKACWVYHMADVVPQDILRCDNIWSKKSFLKFVLEGRIYKYLRFCAAGLFCQLLAGSLLGLWGSQAWLGLFFIS